MKLTPILAAIALAIPATANAQSINDTHKLHFYPAGKNPSSTWVSRTKPVCVNAVDSERTAKEKARCDTAAKVLATPATAN